MHATEVNPCLQLIQQLDEELGIEKFRTELESTQVLVSSIGHSCITTLLLQHISHAG